MEIGEVKAALNHRVRWNSPRCRIDAEYILTACIIRRTDSKFFYQSELQDLKNQKSVCIVRLDEIERL